MQILEIKDIKEFIMILGNMRMGEALKSLDNSGF